MSQDTNTTLPDEVVKQIEAERKIKKENRLWTHGAIIAFTKGMEQGATIAAAHYQSSTKTVNMNTREQRNAEHMAAGLMLQAATELDRATERIKELESTKAHYQSENKRLVELLKAWVKSDYDNDVLDYNINPIETPFKTYWRQYCNGNGIKGE